jgi:hypothetical protein
LAGKGLKCLKSRGAEPFLAATFVFLWAPNCREAAFSMGGDFHSCTLSARKMGLLVRKVKNRLPLRLATCPKNADPEN